MARPPAPKSTRVRDPHVWNPDLEGPKDPINDEPIECRHCPFPKANAIHVSSEELAAELPPAPPEDVTNRILGENE